MGVTSRREGSPQQLSPLEDRPIEVTSIVGLRRNYHRHQQGKEQCLYHSNLAVPGWKEHHPHCAERLVASTMMITVNELPQVCI